MNLEEFNIIIFVTGMILGGGITFAFKSFTSKNSVKQPISNSNLVTIKSLQQELDKKQVIIDDFFTDSNKQLLTVDRQLAELRKSLKNGAGQLSNITIASNILDNETAVETDSTSFEPPRDYALKSDQEQGTLSEKFGLKDESDNLEPARSI